MQTYPGTSYSPFDVWIFSFYLKVLMLLSSSDFHNKSFPWSHLEGIYPSWIFSLLGLYLLCYFFAFIRVDQGNWAHWQPWQCSWLQHSIQVTHLGSSKSNTVLPITSPGSIRRRTSSRTLSLGKKKAANQQIAVRHCEKYWYRVFF